MKFVYFLVPLLVFVFNYCNGQQNDLGSWNIVNIKYSVHDHWSAFGEAQVRSLKFYSNFHYYEFKGGVNYKSHKNVIYTVGTGTYQTYKEGGSFVLPKNNDEFRIWPQLVLIQSIGNLKIEQRYRAEFRFTSNGYKNRFRYRLAASYPFGKVKNDFKPFQFSASKSYFSQPLSPILNETEYSLHSIINPLNHPQSNLAIYISSTIKSMMKPVATFSKLAISSSFSIEK